MGCGAPGWPARGINDYVENWTAANANWEYDGDEDFTTYPGYLAAKSTAGSTFVTFTPLPNSFCPYPRVPTSPYPLVLWNKVRALVPAALGAYDGLAEWYFFQASGDWVGILFAWDNGTGNYAIELNWEKGGVSGAALFDTGIARANDIELDIVLEVTGVSYTVWCNGAFVTFQSGFNFASISDIEITVQRHAANNQAMLHRTEIYTAAP